ncbi:hypothetical protein BP00DRAFT_223615 [Aspergillus indologenus CBS 114.80]|uniref:Uncharacterized protein n=1 Tax=Aspergillus indologenus CBS 114.80 TaxID=1450541 RepID=A0A2V5I715_9EURO|nr:hypothetical protein BP00DRAFT_223615 [Aspergillus indologenus CBS 114.80]
MVFAFCTKAACVWPRVYTRYHDSVGAPHCEHRKHPPVQRLYTHTHRLANCVAPTNPTPECDPGRTLSSSPALSIVQKFASMFLASFHVGMSTMGIMCRRGNFSVRYAASSGRGPSSDWPFGRTAFAESLVVLLVIPRAWMYSPKYGPPTGFVRCYMDIPWSRLDRVCQISFRPRCSSTRFRRDGGRRGLIRQSRNLPPPSTSWNCLRARTYRAQDL